MSTAYHSLTPRQQRVWDAAYGAEFVRMHHQLFELTISHPERAAATAAHYVANLAANSIQPNETEPNECHT